MANEIKGMGELTSEYGVVMVKGKIFINKNV
jgi:hypothetical protein